MYTPLTSTLSLFIHGWGELTLCPCEAYTVSQGLVVPGRLSGENVPVLVDRYVAPDDDSVTYGYIHIISIGNEMVNRYFSIS